LALFRERKTVPALRELMENTALDHQRRRAAYVALGAIGSANSLAPIWNYRARHQTTTGRWNPQSVTTALSYRIEDDISSSNWTEAIRTLTSKTASAKDGQHYTAALSPYLGSYNDIWLGRSDAAGNMTQAVFTGLTYPETEPNRRLRLKSLTVDETGKATIAVEIPPKDEKGAWTAARPVAVGMTEATVDSDGDQLPDLVEQRLQLCVSLADCDGDGINDNEDLNPLASANRKPTAEQELFREAFFAYYSFLRRRGLVVVDPGDSPSVEYYGRQDPVLSLRRGAAERLRAETGLHAIDFVSFGGPYPEGGTSGDAETSVSWRDKHRTAVIAMDIIRSSDNAVAYNVTLKRAGKNWVVVRFNRVWSTN
jgi:hypothetical protein